MDENNLSLCVFLGTFTFFSLPRHRFGFNVHPQMCKKFYAVVLCDKKVLGKLRRFIELELFIPFRVLLPLTSIRFLAINKPFLWMGKM